MGWPMLFWWNMHKRLNYSMGSIRGCAIVEDFQLTYLHFLNFGELVLIHKILRQFDVGCRWSSLFGSWCYIPALLCKLLRIVIVVFYCFTSCLESEILKNNGGCGWDHPGLDRHSRSRHGIFKCWGRVLEWGFRYWSTHRGDNRQWWVRLRYVFTHMWNWMISIQMFLSPFHFDLVFSSSIRTSRLPLPILRRSISKSTATALSCKDCKEMRRVARYCKRLVFGNRIVSI